MLREWADVTGKRWRASEDAGFVAIQYHDATATENGGWVAADSRGDKLALWREIQALDRAASQSTADGMPCEIGRTAGTTNERLSAHSARLAQHGSRLDHHQDQLSEIRRRLARADIYAAWAEPDDAAEMVRKARAKHDGLSTVSEMLIRLNELSEKVDRLERFLDS